MAATRLMALHINKGKSAARSLKSRLDYSQNPEKTAGGALICSYECDPETAWQEFDLSGKAYTRNVGHEGQTRVIAYQIRQSFKPGEITPEEANRLGYETAMRFTKGKHAFTVSTHTDKAHIHNHIIFNAVDLNGTRRWRNFFYSGIALQHLSDLVCAENGLSIITREPGRKRQHTHSHPKRNEWPLSYPENAPQPIGLLVDIEKKLREGKGKGYEIWATGFNAKQQAKVLCFLQDNNIRSFEELNELTDRIYDQFLSLSDEIKEKDRRLSEISLLEKHIANYVKTKAVYDEYRKTGYSKRFREEHSEEIESHRAAKAAFDQLGLKGLPKMKDLKEEYQVLVNKKKALRAKYREVKRTMEDYTRARKNIQLLLGDNEITRGEQAL